MDKKILIEVPKTASAGDYLVIEDGEVVSVLRPTPVKTPKKAESKSEKSTPSTASLKNNSQKSSKRKARGALADLIMDEIESEPGLSAPEVAKRLKETPSTIRTAMGRMLDKGNLSRTYEQNEQGERRYWTYYPKGQGPS